MQTPDEVAKSVVARLTEQVLSKGDLDVFEDLFAEDYVNHNIPVPDIPGTKDGFRELVKATRHAFPDVVVHVDDVVTQGAVVVFRDHVRATSKGDFFGVPANGAVLEWTEIHWLRIVDNRIAEHWTNFDQLGILRQLGALGNAPE
jgi:steroid delta-isomerase-like uncharacterized protein